jgi:hypothetical protein
MSDEYFTNTSIDIRIDPAPHDITDADQVLILFRMPNGTPGEWEAEKFGTSIRYITQPEDIPTAGGVGTWQLEACCVYGTTRKPGKVCYLTLKKPLN